MEKPMASLLGYQMVRRKVGQWLEMQRVRGTWMANRKGIQKAYPMAFDLGSEMEERLEQLREKGLWREKEKGREYRWEVEKDFD